MARKRRLATYAEKEKARRAGESVPTYVWVDTVTGDVSDCSDSSSGYSSYDSGSSSSYDSGSSGCDTGSF